MTLPGDVPHRAEVVSGPASYATRVRNHIRTLRFLADEMTQQALADQIGVSRQTLNAIEGGKYSPSLEVAFKIARVFGKPLGEVFELAAD